MTGLGWVLLQGASKTLEPAEREAVLGDLVEAGDNAGQALLGILGLALRRQISLWRDWRPWAAAFGLALPCTLLLMGISVSVSKAYLQMVDPANLKAAGLSIRPELWPFLCNVVLVVGWAWTGGFVLGSISRRTIWVSAAFSFVPCLFCFSRFNLQELSRLCLFLFLAPALWGLYRGMQIVRIKQTSALVFAVALTALSVPAWSSAGGWIPNWALSWPAWYLVATSRKH